MPKKERLPDRAAYKACFGGSQARSGGAYASPKERHEHPPMELRLNNLAQIVRSANQKTVVMPDPDTGEGLQRFCVIVYPECGRLWKW